MLSRSLLPALPIFLAFLAAAPPTPAQSNTIPGRDIRLLDTWDIRAYVRAGAYPSGASAIGVWSTCCNPGTNPIPFEPAMSPNHGFIHFIVVRESGGRVVQISDWSYVKHTFGSSNDPSPCGNCTNPGTSQVVEPGCLDTYANSQAVDHFWLGPPDEIDPWLGTWVPACSLFDRGDPPAPPSQLCDGNRSLTRTQANLLNTTLHHQMRVRDADLNVTGANFWWQAGYLVPAEAEGNRNNNIGSRPFTPTWNGSSWVMTDGNGFLQGSVLQRWFGASLSSNSNGTDDGRYYVAVKVTGPNNGLYHYEYAVHNRDNKRGLGALRVPICPQARVLGFGFHDIDQDPLNEWTATMSGSEIVFSTVANPLRWNSIFNFWFDSDAAPVTGAALQLDQFAPGSGALTVAVQSTAPLGLYNVTLGPGCGNPAAPTLYATGSPPRATPGNSSFALRSDGNPPGGTCWFVLSLAPGTFPLAPGCTLYSSTLGTLLGPFTRVANASGSAVMLLPVPSQPSLAGAQFDFQMANLHTGGAYLGTFDLSPGLRVRVGDTIPTCP